jgi:hypothetical protein
MTQHHGQLAGITAVEKMHVAMANAGGLSANKNFSWAGLGNRNFLNLHRHINFTKYCCFHGNSPLPELTFECAIAAWAREYAMGHMALFPCVGKNKKRPMAGCFTGGPSASRSLDRADVLGRGGCLWLSF